MFLPTSTSTDTMLMRRDTPADDAAIAVLARLDDKRLPAGPFLVAEMSGEIVAALSLSSGTAVADPFRPTGDAVAMLHLRAMQIGAAGEPAGSRLSRFPQRLVTAATA